MVPVQSIESLTTSHSGPRDRTADLPHATPILFIANFLPHRARSYLPDNSSSSSPTSHPAKSSRCHQTQKCHPNGWSDWEWNQQYQRGARYREVSKGCIPWLAQSVGVLFVGKWEWDRNLITSIQPYLIIFGDLPPPWLHGMGKDASLPIPRSP